jgi:glutathione S-transferase
MLKLYGAARSRAVRVLWMLEELELDYQHIDWLPRSAETQSPEYRALISSGCVPIIDDDGFILSESMAINFYLAKKYNSKLYPSDVQNQALALQWSLWETDRLDRQIVNHARHSRDLPEAERNPEIAKAAWNECAKAFDVLEAALQESEWLAGPAFSVGDLNVASALFRGLALDLSQWPRTRAWLERCWDRPAAQKAKAMRD